MKKKWIIIAAVLVIVVFFIGGQAVRQIRWQNNREVAAAERAPLPTDTEAPVSQTGTEPTAKRSNTIVVDLNQVVAAVGERQLTMGQLQSYYWAEVARYRQEHPQDGPDYDAPLDSQTRSDGGSWQEYFLERALNAWHTAQALIQQSLDDPSQTEESYQPNLDNYAKYLVDIPATKYLYGYSDRYRRNTMHQNYLDALPQTLETLALEKGYQDASDMALQAFGTGLEDLTAWAQDYNEGYMYLTELSYDIQLPQEEVEAYFDANEDRFRLAGITRDSGSLVDIRHMLLIPQAREEGDAALTAPVEIGTDGKVQCTQQQWDACLEEAQALLSSWRNTQRGTEAAFADMAHKSSQDTATALDGGRLCRIARGQLIPELDSWCFDDSRTEADAEIIATDYGYCILYYGGATPVWYAEAEDELRSQRLAELMEKARARYPMTLAEGTVTPGWGEGTVAAGDVLYPDVAHERFPEVPLYLQQDYPTTKFGGNPIRTTGCGITSMAMLASYMADEPLTPPVMCQRFGSYGSSAGTDGTIFNKEPPGMGFYMLRRTFDPSEALEALEQGYLLVSVHHAGYWTRAGHYIVIEKLNEDGTIQVRDSNIYNYNNSYRPAQQGHLVDKHSWNSVVSSTDGFWIFDYKVTHIPACQRCGDISQTNSHILTQGYLCEKCRPAAARREAYLGNP